MTSFGISTDVSLAASVLLGGGIVGMPTETVYGLAALALNEDAVHRVFDTKGRPRNHPLIVHLSKESDISQWGVFNDTARALAAAFWPGPLTLLVPRTTHVPDWVTGGRDTVAIRIPRHVIAQELLSLVNDGVVAPSANRFGKVSPTTAQHVQKDLGGDVDFILDGGPSAVGVESTIVECTDVFQILRPGEISKDDIVRISGLTPGNTSGPSRASGMLESHYAPDVKILITETQQDAQQASDLLPQNTKHRILFYESNSDYAENLYRELRRADEDQLDLLISVRANQTGLGAAINDRLAKAAAQR